MGCKGSVDVVKIVEGGCRGGTGSRMRKLSAVELCLQVYQGKLTLMTQNKLIIVKT